MGTLDKIPWTFNIILLLFGLIFILLGLSSGGITVGDSFSIIIKEAWARNLLIVLGIIQGIVAISLEIRSKLISSGALEEISFFNRSRNLRLPYDKFSKIDEEAFLDKVDLSKVSHLFVLGHTGHNIYTTINRRLEELIPKRYDKQLEEYTSKGNSNFPQEIRILIRAPIVEGLRRNRYIHTVNLPKLVPVISRQI